MPRKKEDEKLSFTSLKKEIRLCIWIVKSDLATEISKQIAQEKLKKIRINNLVPCLMPYCRSMTAHGWYCLKHRFGSTFDVTPNYSKKEYALEFLEEWK